MNIEEQCLDLCNVKTKSNVGDDHNTNTTNNTEGITPRISELMTDSNSEKQQVSTEASETYLMPQLTDNLQAAEEVNHQAQDTLEIDEVNGNGKSSAQDTHAKVNPTDFIISNDEEHNKGEEKIKEDQDSNPAKLDAAEGDDGGDMDIGVDLSLDDTGVLETDSSNVRLLLDSTEDSESAAQDVTASSTPESQSDANQTDFCSTEASATDQAGLYPLVQEGDYKHKPSGKRVTFPSDEDIVSGAVEPKDPWRHGNACFFLYVCTAGVNDFLFMMLSCKNMSLHHGLFKPKLFL